MNMWSSWSQSQWGKLGFDFSWPVYKHCCWRAALWCGPSLLRWNVLVRAVKAKNLTNTVVPGNTAWCIQMRKQVRKKVKGVHVQRSVGALRIYPHEDNRKQWKPWQSPNKNCSKFYTSVAIPGNLQPGIPTCTPCKSGELGVSEKICRDSLEGSWLRSPAGKSHVADGLQFLQGSWENWQVRSGDRDC